MIPRIEQAVITILNGNQLHTIPDPPQHVFIVKAFHTEKNAVADTWLPVIKVDKWSLQRLAVIDSDAMSPAPIELRGLTFDKGERLTGASQGITDTAADPARADYISGHDRSLIGFLRSGRLRRMRFRGRAWR